MQSTETNSLSQAILRELYVSAVAAYSAPVTGNGQTLGEWIAEPVLCAMFGPGADRELRALKLHGLLRAEKLRKWRYLNMRLSDGRLLRATLTPITAEWNQPEVTVDGQRSWVGSYIGCPHVLHYCLTPAGVAAIEASEPAEQAAPQHPPAAANATRPAPLWEETALRLHAEHPDWTRRRVAKETENIIGRRVHPSLLSKQPFKDKWRQLTC